MTLKTLNWILIYTHHILRPALTRANIERGNNMPVLDVETGIPIPAEVKTSTAKTVYPWEQMKIGDSFFVPGGGRKEHDTIRKSTGSQHFFNRYFIIRENQKGSKGAVGIRVWRIRKPRV